jgi:hypothetical protein
MTVADHEMILKGLATSDESPEEHLRNAIQLLTTFHMEHPMVWKLSPDLQAAEDRVWKAIWTLEHRKDPIHE